MNVHVLCLLGVYHMFNNIFIYLYLWFYCYVSQLVQNKLNDIVYTRLCRCLSRLFSHVVVICNVMLFTTLCYTKLYVTCY